MNAIQAYCYLRAYALQGMLLNNPSTPYYATMAQLMPILPMPQQCYIRRSRFFFITSSRPGQEPLPLLPPSSQQPAAVANTSLISTVSSEDVSSSMSSSTPASDDSLPRQVKAEQVLTTPNGRYICPICEKTFRRKWYVVNNHMNIHRNSYPFKCRMCERGFRDNSNRRTHERACRERRERRRERGTL